VWASIAIGAPIFISIMRLREAAYLEAALVLLICVPLGGIWSIGALVAYRWYTFEQKHAGGFWKRWNTQ
jgi:hypothetical protein